MKHVSYQMNKLIDASLQVNRIWDMLLSAAEIVSFNSIWTTGGICVKHDQSSNAQKEYASPLSRRQSSKSWQHLMQARFWEGSISST